MGNKAQLNHQTRKVATRHFALATLLVISVNIPAIAQENLGTAFGIPNSSPGVFWPRGSSVETLGFGRLYPNGPEFGLSNSSGGFGLSGSGRLSGVGLAERSVSMQVQQEMRNGAQVVVSNYRFELNNSLTFLGIPLGRFNSNQPSTVLSFTPSSLVKASDIPNSTVLQDAIPSTDQILKTEL